MSEKRRDNKKRILRSGESQRSDGRYVYKYNDLDGKTKFIYSWKLEPTDRTPKGKHGDLSLREKEKEIERKLDAGIVGHFKMTVSELLKSHIELKQNLSENSLIAYRGIYNIVNRDAFGKRDITKIKMSEAKRWAIKLNTENGYAYSMVDDIRQLIKAAFEQAIQDEFITKNPFNFRLNTVIQNDSKIRKPLSDDTRDAFLDFVKNDKVCQKFYDIFYILFYTGVRASEFCGLIVDDIDFENKKIKIRRQLLRYKGGIMEIQPPKSKSGIREVPMTDEVCRRFKSLISKKKAYKIDPIVDGVQGFLTFTKTERPTTCSDLGNYFIRAKKRYLKYRQESIEVSAHICRHTFCTMLAKKGMNPKVLQYIMGHASIEMTLNVYTQIEYTDANDEFDRIMTA